MFSQVAVSFVGYWSKMKIFTSIREFIVYEDIPRDPEDDEDEKEDIGQ